MCGTVPVLLLWLGRCLWLVPLGCCGSDADVWLANWVTVQTDNVIGWRGYTQLNGLNTNIKKSYTLIPHTSTSTRYLRIRIWNGLLVSSFYAFLWLFLARSNTWFTFLCRICSKSKNKTLRVQFDIVTVWHERSNMCRVHCRPIVPILSVSKISFTKTCQKKRRHLLYSTDTVSSAVVPYMLQLTFVQMNKICR